MKTLKNVLYHTIKESEKIILDWWKSVQFYLYNPVEKPTNQPRD